MSKAIADRAELRQAILDTLRRTGEPMLVKDIATYLINRGWAGNMKARVSSHITSMRAEGMVASMELPTGRIMRLPTGRFELRIRAWFLADVPMEKVRAAALKNIGRKPRFKKPPEPSPRTDDMRQMLHDLGCSW